MSDRLSRRSFLAAAGAGTIALAGCSSLPFVAEEGEAVALGENIDTVTYVGDDPPSGEPDNAPPFGDRRLPIPVSLDELSDNVEDGGPGQDGIPSIDDPTFVSPEEVGGLDEDSVVLAVGGEEPKAYPRRILVHHEIVNDTIDGTPVSVTYCPLTGTAQGFERGETEFGVSGELVNNNLIMYDREAERWWPQIPAVSIPGDWHDTAGGTTLREFDVIRTTWGQWRSVYPETEVLSTDTGSARNYDRDPYGARGYYEDDDTIFPNIYTNDRFHAKEWVYGARTEDGAVAFLRETLHDVGIATVELGENEILAVHDPELDTAYTYWADGDSFSYDNGQAVDESGEAFDPDSLPLERIISFDAYWFAWFAYYPTTKLYE